LSQSATALRDAGTALPAPRAATPTADFCFFYSDAELLRREFRAFGGRRGCTGRVETIKTRDDNSLVKVTLAEAGDGRVLVIDNSASTNCAMLGGDLGQLAADNGWGGIVVFGAVRDVAELQVTPIAVFALAACPRKSARRGIGTRGEPLRVAGTYLRRGDMLAADADGVVVLASWAVS
jgi:regulator of ribonuclease activity A